MDQQFCPCENSSLYPFVCPAKRLRPNSLIAQILNYSGMGRWATNKQMYGFHSVVIYECVI